MDNGNDMTVWARRGLLGVVPGPGGKVDYVASLSTRVPDRALDMPVRLFLRYVPAGAIIPPAKLDVYLSAVADLDWDSLEQLSTTVLSDIINETVARWVQVILEVDTAADDGAPMHQVVVEDREPGWSNPALIGRLKPV